MMTIDSNRVETDVADIFRDVFSDASGVVFAVGFGERATECLIEVVGEVDDPPTIRLLARESVLKWFRSDFLIASAAVDLIAADVLSLRATEDPFENTLLVADEWVVSVVPTTEQVAGLVTDETEFVANAREQWANEWELAEEFSLRTSARSRVEETLAEEFGPDVEADFRTMLDALDTTRGESDDIDEVGISLLAAAKHELLLYDISKWGEDVGVASKATFSRKKTDLEERGVLATEKVPIDVGRPRLRLLLADECLREVEADELVSITQSVVSTAPT